MRPVVAFRITPPQAAVGGNGLRLGPCLYSKQPPKPLPPTALCPSAWTLGTFAWTSALLGWLRKPVLQACLCGSKQPKPPNPAC